MIPDPQMPDYKLLYKQFDWTFNEQICATLVVILANFLPAIELVYPA